MKQFLVLAALLCSCNLFSMSEDTVRVTKPDTSIIYIIQNEVFTLNNESMYKVPIDILEELKRNISVLAKELESYSHDDPRNLTAKSELTKAKKNIKLLEDNYYV